MLGTNPGIKVINGVMIAPDGRIMPWTNGGVMIKPVRIKIARGADGWKRVHDHNLIGKFVYAYPL